MVHWLEIPVHCVSLCFNWRNARCQVKFCNNKKLDYLFQKIDIQGHIYSKKTHQSIQPKAPNLSLTWNHQQSAFVGVTHRSERFGYSSRIRPMKRKLFSGTPMTFIFKGYNIYNPYFWGCKTLFFFMVLGSKGIIRVYKYIYICIYIYIEDDLSIVKHSLSILLLKMSRPFFSDR